MRQYIIGILIILSFILTNCESPYENWEEVELYSEIDLLNEAGSNGTPRAFIALRPIQKTGVVLLGKRNESEGSQLFYALSRELIRLL